MIAGGFFDFGYDFGLGWMTTRDLTQVVEIAGCSPYPLYPRGVRRLLSHRGVIGQVARGPGGIVFGFSIYQLDPAEIEVHALAVGPPARRRGVGRALVAALRSKLAPTGWGRPARSRLTARVRETDDRARAFWQAMGARAVGVDREHYRGPGGEEDAYVMAIAGVAAARVGVGNGTEGNQSN